MALDGDQVVAVVGRAHWITLDSDHHNRPSNTKISCKATPILTLRGFVSFILLLDGDLVQPGYIAYRCPGTWLTLPELAREDEGCPGWRQALCSNDSVS